MPDSLSIYVCFVQMEAQAEEWSAEAQKEKKLRERSEQYSRQLEEELEGTKVCTNLQKRFSLLYYSSRKLICDDLLVSCGGAAEACGPFSGRQDLRAQQGAQ